jgi:hypothetical protein
LSVEEKFEILKGDICVIVGSVGLARGGIVGELKSAFEMEESVGVAELLSAGVCENFVPGRGGGHVFFQMVYALLR